MIIDCHGHYTTAPEALASWRDRQIAAVGSPSHRPSPSELHISDDELRESIESNQLAKMRERGSDLTIFSPRASFMAHHIGGLEESSAWAAICNELIRMAPPVLDYRRGDLRNHRSGYRTSPMGPKPLYQGSTGFVGVNLNPDPQAAIGRIAAVGFLLVSNLRAHGRAGPFRRWCTRINELSACAFTTTGPTILVPTPPPSCSVSQQFI